MFISTRFILSCQVAGTIIALLLAGCEAGPGVPQSSAASSDARGSFSSSSSTKAGPVGFAPHPGPLVIATATRADRVAATRTRHFWYHTMPVHGGRPSGPHAHAATYPGDLTYNVGPFMTTARQHLVFVNCGSSCWGNPALLVADLNLSPMIHVVDQYVGSTTASRYPNSTGVLLSASLQHYVYDSDIQMLLHSAISALKGNPTGYTDEYHIFLPKGQDACYQSGFNNYCYSPDNTYTFSWCAYHSSIDFSDFGHVVFSVEPYQAVTGCQENPIPSKAFPNNLVTDSTDSTLSHEMFESITDPDGTAWYNSKNLDLYGYEIADECQTRASQGVIVALNKHNFQIQQEYSNTNHACMP